MSVKRAANMCDKLIEYVIILTTCYFSFHRWPLTRRKYSHVFSKTGSLTKRVN